ncbi:MAG: DinB family protein [Candidatus Sumerlaeia bacterium]|nr:DinB family protein [Candidatus Sumerlaeia bacterium]
MPPSPISYSLDSLRKLASLIEGMSADDYARCCPGFYNASIGKHTRHAVDHYDRLLAQRGGEIVDYDRRERGGAIETDRALALSEISRLGDELSRTGEAELPAPIRIRMMMGDSPDSEVLLDTTLGRELAFCASHCVHHLALMTVMARSLGAEADDALGLAPSTAAHFASKSG